VIIWCFKGVSNIFSQNSYEYLIGEWQDRVDAKWEQLQRREEARV